MTRPTRDRLATVAADANPDDEAPEGGSTESTAGDEKPAEPPQRNTKAPRAPKAPRAAASSEKYRVVDADGSVQAEWPFGYDDSTIEQKQEVVNFWKDKSLNGWQLLPEDPRTTFDRRKEEAKRKKREETLI